MIFKMHSLELTGFHLITVFVNVREQFFVCGQTEAPVITTITYTTETNVHAAASLYHEKHKYH